MNRLRNELFNYKEYIIRTIVDKKSNYCHEKCFFKKKQNNIYVYGLCRQYTFIKGHCRYINRRDGHSILFKIKKI